MDVILDTNIYVSLLRNSGSAFFESAEFVSLLAYLRRMDNSLVIPDVVYEEFRHEYYDRVQLSFKKAQDAWDSHVRDLAGPKHFPHTLNIEKAWKKIEADFLKPDKSVNVIHYRDYSKIPVEQVVKRGVYRIPPANSNGEELRDVVLWLMALEYARGKKLAFVCPDGHFRSGNDLHPDLQKEASSYNVEITLYRSLPDFIKGNSLASSPISVKDYRELLSEEEIRKNLADYLIGGTLQSNTITSAVIEDIDLHEGTRYEISADSFYIELTIKGLARLQMKTPEMITFAAGTVISPLKQPRLFDEVSYGETGPAYYALAGMQPFQSLGLHTVQLPAIPNSKTLTTDAKFLAYYRIRVTNNQRQSAEIDHIFMAEMTDFREIPTPVPDQPTDPPYPQK